MNLVAYHLNAADEITAVNDEWVRFALANHGESYLPERVLAHEIWEFIHDDVTVQLYRELFARARQGMTMRFSFRCDGPETRRLLEMAIRPDQDGGLELQVTPLSEAHRAPQELLRNRAVSMPEKFLIMCGWCKRVQVGLNEWEEVEDAVVHLGLFEKQDTTQVSHGICQSCYDRVFEKINGRES